MQDRTTGHTAQIWSANRLGLEYCAEGKRLGPPPLPIIDAHAHINGGRASQIYQRVADCYGVARVYSQTRLDQANAVRGTLGDRVRFVAGPDYSGEDRSFAFREGFLNNVVRFREEFASRMVKFWTAPRYRDYVDPHDDRDIYFLDSEWRVRIAQAAVDMGMMCMTHVADPDTWFRGKYTDAKKYGTKQEQYEPLERMLERFKVPWIAAHMGGWPENLGFLDGLLSRHDNLYLDTSATKWMVRELSRHSRQDLLTFMRRWDGRILFGSDIVTSDDHLQTTDPESTRYAAHQASNPDEAFQLYASRYWALRTLFETDAQTQSPIADPDLMMVEPDTYDEMSAPMLMGKSLPDDLLRSLYAGTAESLLDRWWDEHA